MIRCLAAAALAAATLSLGADDPNAPLANTKQQLQSLQKDEAAHKARTQDGVKLSLPALNAPGQGTDLPAPKRDVPDRAQPAGAAQQNWLLEGFDRLDGKRDATKGTRTGKQAEGDQKLLDPSAPDYFLRLYERQRAGAAVKPQGNQSTPGAELRVGSNVDPFAPFMKEWLANSPVRDALKDTLGRESGPESINASTTGPQTDHTFTVTTAPANEAVPPTHANPFIQALGLSSADTRPADRRMPVPDAASPFGTPPARDAASTVYDLPERPKADLKRTLPPPPSEDKKYFPQLKKF